ncbi:protein of unknown function [Paraburkholderia kururiensis]
MTYPPYAPLRASLHHRQQASSETSQLTLILDEESGMELLMGFVMTLCISLLIFHK